MNIGLWGLEKTGADHLAFGGSDLVELAETYGTPLHVVDEGRLRSNYRAFLGAFERHYPATKVFCSYKTNSVPAVINVLHDEGAGAEVVSPYEFWLARRCGVAPADIVYNGVNKSTGNLSSAIDCGTGTINIDSVGEIDRLADIGVTAESATKFGLRVDPNVGWNAQFGVQPRQDVLAHLRQRWDRDALSRLRGIHAHNGSGVADPGHYRKTLEVLCATAGRMKTELGAAIDFIDIGGGFGRPTVRPLRLHEVAAYRLLGITPRAPDATKFPSIDTYARTVADTLISACKKYDLGEPTLYLEPGRALTSDAQILLLRVGDIKSGRGGKTFAVTDGGMQNIAFPLSYEYHACLLVNRASAAADRRYHVVGPLCSPEDILYRNWPLPELQPGDLLAVMDAGAYFTAWANNFSYPRPAAAMVSDGKHSLVRERESFEHLIALDRI